MRVEVGGNAVAYRDEALHVVFAQSVDLAQSQAQRERLISRASLQVSWSWEGGRLARRVEFVTPYHPTGGLTEHRHPQAARCSCCEG